MKNNDNAKKTESMLGYRIFKSYVRFYYAKFYCRKLYAVNTENIPQNCPLLIASDHQNSLNDALALISSINSRKERKIRAITRADAFNRPVFGRILRWSGLLPAFRLAYDGADNLSKNTSTFSEVGEELMKDGTIIIYPEGKHQSKRWLGEFSYGYLRMLFETAENSNFEKEIFILPSCNHYSNYFGLREEALIKFGTPISLAPYYELYKTKPRTAQRQVNALVRKQITDLMLNITDLENYESIDFLRNTYGIDFAWKNGFNPEKLPEKLLADKKLVAQLDATKAEDENSVLSIYKEVNVLEGQQKELKIRDKSFDKKISPLNVFLQGLSLAVLSPLFLVAVLHNLLIIIPPKLINTKIEDRMLHGTINLVMTILITMPISYALIFLLTWFITKSFVIALIYLLFLPFLGIFVVQYAKRAQNWLYQWRFQRLFKKGKLNELIQLRKNIHQALDKLLK